MILCLFKIYGGWIYQINNKVILCASKKQENKEAVSVL